MRGLGAKLIAIGMVALGATLGACISQSSSAPPFEDAGSIVLPDGALFSTEGGVFPDGGRPPVDASHAETGTGTDAGADAAPDGSGSPGEDAGTDAAPTCGLNNGGCEVNSTCVLGGGAITCVCNAGYSGAGCASSCLTSNGGCDPNATCSNGDAGVLCACNAGYQGDGGTCASDCLTSNGGCDPNATCAVDAGVVCACNPGYGGNGLTCLSDDYEQWPPPPDFPPQAQYAVSADGTVVTDMATGLTWQRMVFGNPCPADVSGGVAGCTWAHAQAYCASLDTLGGVGLGSVGGWRVPSLVELVSIVDYHDGVPTIDTSPFPLTPAVPFWALTQDSLDTTQSWTVSFGTGVNATQTATAVAPIRCVTSVTPPAVTPTCGTLGLACCYANSCGTGLACASGTCVTDLSFTQTLVSDTPAEAQYSVSTDGTIVSDGTTGLTWQRDVLASPCPADGASGCTWAHAQTYCGSLDAVGSGGLGNVKGWRLPALGELLSIVSYGVGVPTIDTAPFGNTPAVSFWTQTPDSLDATQAWSISFGNGTNASLAAVAAEEVRCVTSSVPGSFSPTCGTAGLPCCYANICGSGLTCLAGTCATDVTFVQTVAPDVTPEAQYAASPDGTLVTDSVTGLHWQRQLYADPCPADGPGACTWADAATYCASLDAQNVGGISSGWRLPSLFELVSIVSYGDGVPTIDTSLFPDTPLSYFWTQTPSSLAGGQSWGVSFSHGVNALLVTTSAQGVRCVSADPPTSTPTCGGLGGACCYSSSCGPQLTCNTSSACETDLEYVQTVAPDFDPEPQYTVSPGGSVVTDHVTGLVWERPAVLNPCTSDAGGGGCTWSEAAAYCASLDAVPLGGYGSGWRLPTLVELVSIANYGVAPPTIDSSYFPETPFTGFWTQSPDSLDATQAWSVTFATGVNSTQLLTTALLARCVNSSGVTPQPEGCGALGQACCYASECGAALACVAGACVMDSNYVLWTPIPPDAPPAAQYTVAGSGKTATDATTGLVWALGAAGGSPCPGDTAPGCTQPHAAAFCASLNGAAYGGLGSGWRLPSLVELVSIVNYGVASGATVDTGVFGASVTASSYWTQTLASTTAGDAWSVDFSNGVNATVATSTSLAPLCVNGP